MLSRISTSLKSCPLESRIQFLPRAAEIGTIATLARHTWKVNLRQATSIVYLSSVALLSVLGQCTFSFIFLLTFITGSFSWLNVSDSALVGVAVLSFAAGTLCRFVSKRPPLPAAYRATAPRASHESSH